MNNTSICLLVSMHLFAQDCVYVVKQNANTPLYVNKL